jgi:myotubularin-related protein 1/2
VEKDWLAYGHLFAERLGTPTYTGIHIVPSSESLVLQMGSVSTSPVRGAPGSAFTSAGSHSPAALSSNYSPIFLQWIDCVAQLLRIYPSAFEFSAVSSKLCSVLFLVGIMYNSIVEAGFSICT